MVAKVLKKIVGPKMGPIRAKKGPKGGLRLFYVQNASVFPDFSYYDTEL